MSLIELSITGDDGVRRVLVSNHIIAESPLSGDSLPLPSPAVAPQYSSTSSNHGAVLELSRREAWRTSQLCFAAVTMYLPLEPMDKDAVDLVVALRKQFAMPARPPADGPAMAGYAVGSVVGDVVVAGGRQAVDGLGETKPAE